MEQYRVVAVKLLLYCAVCSTMYVYVCTYVCASVCRKDQTNRE